MPITRPVEVRRDSSAAIAMPKSMTTGSSRSPSGSKPVRSSSSAPRSITLLGLRSRWITPEAWMAWRVSPITRPISRTASGSQPAVGAHRVLERRPGDELGDHEGVRGVELRVEDPHDVVVAHQLLRGDLTSQAFASPWIVRDLVAEQLDGHIVPVGVVRAVDDPHPPGTDPPDDLVTGFLGERGQPWVAGFAAGGAGLGHARHATRPVRRTHCSIHRSPTASAPRRHPRHGVRRP